MAENSKIEWTDHTFNPWIGCHKVSDGCKNCYAEAMMDKRYGKVQWGVHGTRKRTSEQYWKQPIRWDHQAGKEGVRRRVFCASLADVMEDRPELQVLREELFKLIESTPNLDWLLLTKRPENFKRFLPDTWLETPLHNVWLGTSVEDQKSYDERVLHLVTIPAVTRFLSAEPLLGDVDLGLFGIIPATIVPCYAPLYQRIHWVIAGGESGRNARPMHLQWVRSLREQCTAAGVAFFFKQWGEYSPYYEAVDEGNHRLVVREFQEGVLRVGKSKSGRLLDEREWNEVPEYHMNHQLP